MIRMHDDGPPNMGVPGVKSEGSGGPKSGIPGLGLSAPRRPRQEYLPHIPRHALALFAGDANLIHAPLGGIPQEEVMAKGQMRSNKEKKKPKTDKDKPKQVSAYKSSQMAGGNAATPFAKKN